MNCHAEGIRKAKGGGLYRPPSNTTLLVHNLKNGGFHYAAKMMIDGADSYVHKDCTADLGSVRRKKSQDEKLAKQAERAAARQPAGRRNGKAKGNGGGGRGGGGGGGGGGRGGKGMRAGRLGGVSRGKAAETASLLDGEGGSSVGSSFLGHLRRGQRSLTKSWAKRLGLGGDAAAASAAPKTFEFKARMAEADEEPPAQPFDMIAGS